MNISKTLTVIGLYLIGFLALAFYFHLEDSEWVSGLFQRAGRQSSQYGLAAVLGIALTKTVSLIMGILIPVFLTFLLIYEYFQDRKQ